MDALASFAGAHATPYAQAEAGDHIPIAGL